MDEPQTKEKGLPGSTENFRLYNPHGRRHTDSQASKDASPQMDLLRHQNADLRRALTGALEECSASKRALRQAQTFERIGRVSSTVVHDFNNYISGILGLVGEVHDELGPESAHRAPLEIALTAARKASQLSKRLLSLGRRQTIALDSLDWNSLIREMNALLSRMLGESIQLEVFLEPALGHIKADPLQMEQVLLNLVLNARDAMPLGGKLTLRTSNFTAVEVVSHLGRLPCVRLEVLDTGIGMDSKTLERAFEPFFTTKDAIHGTGLGLASIKTIIEEHEGDISVVSAPRLGTCFTILLPRIKS